MTELISESEMLLVQYNFSYYQKIDYREIRRLFN